MAVEFDPSKPFTQAEPIVPQFDPSKPFATADQSQPASQDQHGFGTALHHAISGAKDLALNAGSGLMHAAFNPVDAAGEVVDTLSSPILHPLDTLSGAYRTARNVPVLGPAIDESVKSAIGLGNLVSGKTPQESEQAISDFAKHQTEGDLQHAQDHPLTDFIQKNAGLAALPADATAAAATLATDAFAKSLNAGNSVSDALKDARNVGILSGLAMKGGQLAYAKTLGKLGTPAEAIEAVPESIIPEEPSPIPNFPSKSDLAASLRGSPSPEAAMPVSGEFPLPANASTLPQQPSHFFEKAGKWVGGGAGGFLGHALGHDLPFGLAETIGVGGGTFVGKSIGSQLDNLVNTYGAQAVNAVKNAGIPLEGLANSQYITPIMQAAQKGTVPLAVTYYMIQQTDPDAQKAIMQAQH